MYLTKFYMSLPRRLGNMMRLLRKPRNAAIALKYFFWTNITLFIIIGLLVYFKWFSAVTKFVSDKHSVNSLAEPPTGTDKIGDAAKLTAPNSFFDEPRNLEGLKIDWHNYQLMNEEKKRTGLGEGGQPGAVSAREKVLELDISLQNGFNGLLSDKISVNRSLPDLRHEDCRDKKYLAELPTVSVIFPFFDEHWTTLLRSVYSILNRSPPQLIKEIILVNDHSDREILYEPLERFIQKNLPKVKLVHLPQRSGLIKARLAGAEIAKADVLVFLDSHIEVTVNWLPPLLEPIAENYKVCVCPLIDVISHSTFQYTKQDDGARGAFNWGFFYKRLPLLPRDLLDLSAPFESPIMAGGLFAISAKFFWELGGYDEGLDIWGGEQYELSFKIWQCGGKMYDAPCSRVGHIYRGPRKGTKVARSYDYVTKNFKRVAEVWMDEYKEIIYNRNPQRYAKVDPGDLTKQKAIREKLQCKSFKWFLENVAMDLTEKYPPYPPPSYASGAIQSVAKPSECIDLLGSGPMGLYPCGKDHKEPQDSQYFVLSWPRDIRQHNDEICWEAGGGAKADLYRVGCHGHQGSQLWKYNYKTKTIHYGVGDFTRCLEVDIEENKVFVNKCDVLDSNQQWNWGSFNATMIDAWDETVDEKFQKNK